MSANARWSDTSLSWCEDKLGSKMYWFKVSGKAGYWQVEIQDRKSSGVFCSSPVVVNTIKPPGKLAAETPQSLRSAQAARACRRRPCVGHLPR